ncbi:pilus assembly FimT family protein [Aliikangiella sp. IMCC44653]
MKNLSTKAQGFTLIELIVVIVILGIMSAIAVPQFINLQSDARASVGGGIEGSLRSAATLAYSKALIDGSEGAATGTITTSGGNVAIIEGYPAPTAAGIGTMVDLGGSDVAVAYSGSVATYTISAITACTVTYTHAAGSTPAIANNATAANC